MNTFQKRKILMVFYALYTYDIAKRSLKSKQP